MMQDVDLSVEKLSEGFHLISYLWKHFNKKVKYHMSPKKVAETPLMQQYTTIKAKHPDAILLFRMGDFYETFGEDAIKTSEILHNPYKTR